jgi:hypothetical protein
VQGICVARGGFVEAARGRHDARRMAGAAAGRKRVPLRRESGRGAHGRSRDAGGGDSPGGRVRVLLVMGLTHLSRPPIKLVFELEARNYL